MALSKTGRFLSKAEILGVGVFSPLSFEIVTILMCDLGTLGVPPWSLFLSKIYRDFEASSLEILVFRGTFCPIFVQCQTPP